MRQVPEHSQRKDEFAAGDERKAEERGTAYDFRVVEIPGRHGTQDAAPNVEIWSAYTHR